MDVGKLFDLPKVSSSSLSKRKWAEPDSSTQIKSVRLDQDKVQDQQQQDRPSSPPSSSSSSSSSSHPALQKTTTTTGLSTTTPDDSVTYDEQDQDDEGGRFFGGGLTSEQKNILEIMNNADDQQPALSSEEELSRTRKLILRLERSINKNNEMRSKFPDQPSKFIDSEVDLDADIKRLLVLTTKPALFYPELIRTNSVASICTILSHDNIDIAAAAIELIDELTDDSVLDSDQPAQEPTEAQAAMTALVDSLLASQILELLVSNLSRFNDTPTASSSSSSSSPQFESDIHAVYHTLSVLENLLSTRPHVALTLVSTTSYLSWSLSRIQKPEFDQNKAYAAELLSIVLQDSSSNQASLGAAGGIDALLTVLSAYRKHDPADDDEQEFMHNSFDILCSLLAIPENRQVFYAAEGIDLMLLLIKSKLSSKERAIQVIDYALTLTPPSPNTLSCAQALIDAGGLGILFPTFMRKINQHLISIFASLLTTLPSDSAHRIRLLSKFAETAYAKTDRILELRSTVTDQLHLFLIDYIIAWLVMEDDGIQTHVKLLLKRSDTSLASIIDNLKQYYHSMETEDGSETEVQKITVLLVNYLLGCD